MSNTFEIRNGVKFCHIKNDSPVSYFGIISLNGSNFELDGESGISHFCEHMFFKGTKSRDYNQINNELGLLGAKPNAYTSRQAVVYYATCPSFNFKKVAEIICDMFFNSEFPLEEIEKERKVILEERAMYNDSKEHSFMEFVFEKIFGKYVGGSILGSDQNISKIGRDDILSFLRRTINLENVVFVCSGPNPIEELFEAVEQFNPSEKLSKDCSEFTCLTKKLIDYPSTFKFKKDSNGHNLVYYRDEMEQAHLGINLPSLPVIVDGQLNKDTFVESVALNAFGGGMYSVLFDEVREKKGLCYGIHCSKHSLNYFSNGLAYIDSQTSYDRLPKLIDAIQSSIDKVLKEGIPQTAFECAKANAVSSFAHNSEKSSSKVGDTSELAFLFDKKMSTEEKLKVYDGITIDQANDVFVKLFSSDERNVSVMMDSKYK